MNIKTIAASLALSALIFGAASGAIAQDHHDDDRNRPHDQHDQRDRRDDHGQPHRYVQHREWRRGARMNQDDWNRGERIDYRRYHLRAPRRGYEWREVDGNYVMAAVATGVIANVIANSMR